VRRRIQAVFLLLLALACGRREERTGSADPATLRHTGSGDVVGFVTPDGAHAWLGIPFARPPVGELRWRAPQPPDPWPGTREALAFAPSCPQLAGPLGGRDGAGRGRPTGSEDCLYLNVYAPPFGPEEVPRERERLPVMVWIHGGGNTIGDAVQYDGSVLARTGGVVVVTVHYRLGVLGWLSHPALRDAAASPDDASGNYGTLDLVRALEWVRDHAAVFGGDPGRVTIFGESAGAANVFSLLVSPRAKGLFHRAIAQSGSTETFSRDQAEHFADDPEPGHPRSSREVLLDLLGEADAAEGREAAKARLAAMTPAEVVRFLRGLPPETLLGAYDGSRLGGMYHAPRLIRDGSVLPEAEIPELLRAGAYHRVPAVLGTNRDENKLFLAFGSPHVTRVLGLPVGIADPRRYDLEAEYAALLWKARGADEPAMAMHAAQGPSVFAYRFDWDDERRWLWLDLGRLFGAAHGVELLFLFGRGQVFGSDLLFDPERREADQRLADAMLSYWARFAASGDPGRGRTGELPLWEPWSETEGHRFAILDVPEDGGIRMGSTPVTRAEVVARVATDPRFASDAERCAVWGSFVVWGSAMSEDEYRAAAGGACAAIPLPKPF
jgi:para-nitrobenzyl esterase